MAYEKICTPNNRTCSLFAISANVPFAYINCTQYTLKHWSSMQFNMHPEHVIKHANLISALNFKHQTNFYCLVPSSRNNAQCGWCALHTHTSLQTKFGWKLSLGPSSEFNMKHAFLFSMHTNIHHSKMCWNVGFWGTYSLSGFIIIIENGCNARRVLGASPPPAGGKCNFAVLT